MKGPSPLELAIRTIEEDLPAMSTPAVQKWHTILKMALLKTERELTASRIHRCKICFLEESGYRNELPPGWYIKGDAEVCFQHDYKDAERLLKEAGYEDDAFFPPEIPTPSIDALKLHMDTLPEPPSELDNTLDELMSIDI